VSKEDHVTRNVPGPIAFRNTNTVNGNGRRRGLVVGKVRQRDQIRARVCDACRARNAWTAAGAGNGRRRFMRKLLKWSRRPPRGTEASVLFLWCLGLHPDANRQRPPSTGCAQCGTDVIPTTLPDPTTPAAGIDARVVPGAYDGVSPYYTVPYPPWWSCSLVPWESSEADRLHSSQILLHSALGTSQTQRLRGPELADPQSRLASQRPYRSNCRGAFIDCFIVSLLPFCSIESQRLSQVAF